MGHTGSPITPVVLGKLFRALILSIAPWVNWTLIRQSGVMSFLFLITYLACISLALRRWIFASTDSVVSEFMLTIQAFLSLEDLTEVPSGLVHLAMKPYCSASACRR